MTQRLPLVSFGTFCHKPVQTCINLGLTDNGDEEKFLADVKEFMHNDLIVIEKETLHKSILGTIDHY